MSDYLDYIAIWFPIVAGAVAFLIVGFLISRDLDGIGRFDKFVRIFLSEGATLKTWGLFISAFTIALLLSGVIAKMATDSAWMRDLNIQSQRITFFKDIAIGLEVLLSIVLGAFGAVAFKGQGPGGINFQLNQDAAGNVSQSSSAPVKPPVDNKGG